MPNWATSDQFLALSSRIMGLLSTVPVSKVRLGVMAVIVVWFLSLLADIVWLLVPSPDVSAQLALKHVKSAPRAQAKKKTSAFDVKAMQDWHLFGASEVEAVESPDDTDIQQPSSDDMLAGVDATNLQLKLMGVMRSGEGSDSHAVIEHQSQSELYKVGDKIPGGRDVSLAWVLDDRVVIDNRGIREFLMLYDESGKPEIAVPANTRGKRGKKNKKGRSGKKQVLDKRGDGNLEKMANDYRNRLLDNPMSLADVIKVSVAKDAEGSVIGYRIRPGRDRKQFNDFGLKSGDIVTSINGLSLDDPSRAMELYGQLREAKEASFVVKRGDEEINLILGLSE